MKKENDMKTFLQKEKIDKNKNLKDKNSENNVAKIHHLDL